MVFKSTRFTRSIGPPKGGPFNLGFVCSFFFKISFCFLWLLAFVAFVAFVGSVAFVASVIFGFGGFRGFCGFWLSWLSWLPWLLWLLWRLAFVAFVASGCLLLVHLWRNVKSEAQLPDVRRSCFHPNDSFGGFWLLVAFRFWWLLMTLAFGASAGFCWLFVSSCTDMVLICLAVCQLRQLPNLSTYPSICLYLSIFLSVCLSIYLTVLLSFCLSFFLFWSFFLSLWQLFSFLFLRLLFHLFALQRRNQTRKQQASKQARAAHLWIWCAAGGGAAPPPNPPRATKSALHLRHSRLPRNQSLR